MINGDITVILLIIELIFIYLTKLYIYVYIIKFILCDNLLYYFVDEENYIFRKLYIYNFLFS